MRARSASFRLLFCSWARRSSVSPAARARTLPVEQRHRRAGRHHVHGRRGRLPQRRAARAAPTTTTTETTTGGAGGRQFSDREQLRRSGVGRRAERQSQDTFCPRGAAQARSGWIRPRLHAPHGVGRPILGPDRVRVRRPGDGSLRDGGLRKQGKSGGAGGKPPATLAEFQLAGFGGKDFYDISLVDGYNLPMRITPVAGTFTPWTRTTPMTAAPPGAAPISTPRAPRSSSRRTRPARWWPV